MYPLERIVPIIRPRPPPPQPHIRIPHLQHVPIGTIRHPKQYLEMRRFRSSLDSILVDEHSDIKSRNDRRIHSQFSRAVHIPPSTDDDEINAVA